MLVELRGVRWDQGQDGKVSRGFPMAGEGGLDLRQFLWDWCVDGQLLQDSSECAPLTEPQKANTFWQKWNIQLFWQKRNKRVMSVQNRVMSVQISFISISNFSLYLINLQFFSLSYCPSPLFLWYYHPSIEWLKSSLFRFEFLSTKLLTFPIRLIWH